MFNQVVDITESVWVRGFPESENPVIVALHGYGSHEHDLPQLAQHLPLEFDFVSLRAPLPQDDGPGFQWFPLNSAPGQRYAKINVGADAVERWFAATFNPDKTVIPLGFSQGGAVAMQLIRRQPTRFPGAVALSSLLAPTAEPGDATLKEAPVPVFWGHADRDSIISMFSPTLTPDWLHEHTVLTERIYPGIDHSICLEELQDISQWLGELNP